MQGKLQPLVQDPGAAMVLFLMCCMAAASLLKDPSSNSWMICEHVGGLYMFRSMGGLGWGWEGDGEGYLVQGARCYPVSNTILERMWRGREGIRGGVGGGSCGDLTCSD